jgi:hypothetical protein
VSDADFHDPSEHDKEKTVPSGAQSFCFALHDVGRGIVCRICDGRVGKRLAAKTGTDASAAMPVLSAIA